MFDNLEKKFDEKHQDVMTVLERIETQTMKTNGRVNKLELWRNIIIGGGLVIMACGTLFARLYVQDIARTTAEQVVQNINSNWDVKIQK